MKKIILLMFVFILALMSLAVAYEAESGCLSYFNFDNLSNYCQTETAINNGSTTSSIYPSYNTSGNSANSSYSFDGSNDYIKINNTLVNNTNFTITAWINSSSYTQTPTIIGTIDVTSVSAGLYLGIDTLSRLTFIGEGTNGGGLDVVIDGSSNCAEGVCVTNNIWNFVYIHKNVTNYKLCVNNNCITENANEYTPISQPLYIGGIGTGTRYFSGKIDDVKIFDRALSDVERLELYNYGNINGYTGIVYTPPQNFIQDNTNISYNTATFNGYATLGNCTSYNISFEYGSVVNYESDNQSVTLTGNTTNSTQINFYTDVTGLSEGTLYKVRNVFTCNDETNIGGVYQSSYSEFVTLGDVVIISSGTNRTAVSNNGVSYTLGDELNLKDIYYNPNLALYTAIDNNGTFYTSSDGLTWEIEFYSTCQSYTYDIHKGYLVACSSQGALYNDDLTGAFVNGDLTIVSSLNGFSDEYNYGYASTWDKFYYVNTDGNVFISSNGLNWTNTANIGNWNFGKVVYYNDDIGALFVSGSSVSSGIYSGFPTTTNLYYSLDGTTFTLLYQDGSGGLHDILYSVEDDVLLFSLYSGSDGAVKITQNLTNITSIGITTWGGSIKKVAYNDGKYIFYYNDRVGTYVTNDFINYNITGTLLTDNNRLYGSEVTNLFYHLSDSVYRYSSDGITWTNVTTGTPIDSVLYVFDEVTSLFNYARTLSAYDMTNTTAKLLGDFYLYNCSEIEAYFQYGVNPSYTTSTPFTLNTDSQLETLVSSLLPNTTYSYRAVADINTNYCDTSSNFTAYGEWEYFTTLANVIPVMPVGELSLDAYIPDIQADVNETFSIELDDYFSNYTEIRVSYNVDGNIFLYYNESDTNSRFSVYVGSLNNAWFVNFSTIGEGNTFITITAFQGIESVSDSFYLDISTDFEGVNEYSPPTFYTSDIIETSTSALFITEFTNLGNCSNGDLYILNYKLGDNLTPVLIAENVNSTRQINYTFTNLTPSTLYSYNTIFQCDITLIITQNILSTYTTLSSGTIIINPPSSGNSEFDGLWDTFTGGSTKTKMFIAIVLIFAITFISFGVAGQNNIQLGFFGIFIIVMLSVILTTALGLLPPYVLILIIVIAIIGLLLRNILGGSE